MVSSITDEGVGVGGCADSDQSSWLETEVIVGINVIISRVRVRAGARVSWVQGWGQGQG